jgi:hypothetical protein
MDSMSKRILFIIGAVILAAGGIFFRASNSHSARVQADRIVSADAAGTDTTADIASLKSFVATHMGASTSFTLKSSYDRAGSAAVAAASAAKPSNQIYVDAQKACAGKSDSVTQARCNQNYLAQHLTAAPTPAPVPAPKLADFQYSYKAPLWTPDLAGSLMLGASASVAFGLLLVKPKQKGRR